MQLSGFLKKVTSKLDVHTLEVIRKSSASLIVKILGMLAGLGVSITLGRELGSEGLGIIDLANKIVSILLVIGLLGFPQVIIKHLAIAFSKKNWQHISDVMFTSFMVLGGTTLFVAVLCIVLAPWLANTVFKEAQLIYPLIVALVVAVPQVFSRIFASALIGFRKIWQGNLVEQTLSIGVVGILLMFAYLLNYDITIKLVAVFYAFARIVVTLTMFLYWKHIFPYKVKRNFIPRTLLKTSLPLLLVSAALLISSSLDSVMLGWLSSAEEVGLYSVALRIALLTSFIQQITISTVAPKIASLHSEGRFIELEQMVQRVTQVLTFIGLFILIVTVFVGNYALSLWGVEFKGAYIVLIILSVGQFFNMASGPVGNLLIMSGNERVVKNVTLYTLLLNIILNYILIQLFNGEGAAIATSVTVVLNMALCLYYVRKKLGISPIKWNLRI